VFIHPRRRPFRFLVNFFLDYRWAAAGERFEDGDMEAAFADEWAATAVGRARLTGVASMAVRAGRGARRQPLHKLRAAENACHGKSLGG
jgi:hypothetical protein